MPLKVSSIGWVKVAPPPNSGRRRQVDPEVQKEAFCSPLRYFACQTIDPSRERLRMLGGRIGLNSSQTDLRPHSRLERSSTLDEWRHDVYPSRSSSRQSAHIVENIEPHREARAVDGRSGSDSRRASRKERAASAPIIISASPSPSVYEEDDIVEVERHPDNVSVAYSETPSERHCRRHHRHNKPRKVPAAIQEEEELEAFANPHHLWYGDEEREVPISVPAPPPSLARSDTMRTRRTEVEIDCVPTLEPNKAPELIDSLTSLPTTEPTKSLEPIPEQSPLVTEKEQTKSVTEKPVQDLVANTAPTPTPVPIPVAASIEPQKSHRSKRSEKSDRSDASSVSSKSSRSTASSRSSRSSSSYTSSHADTESDTASSYTASVRSASPLRERSNSRKHDRHNKSYEFTHNDKVYEKDSRQALRSDSYYDKARTRTHYDIDDTSSYYSSPPPSPPPISRRRSRYESEVRMNPAEAPATRAYRERIPSAPLPSRSKPSPALSASSWSSKGSSISSSSGSSRSSAPSIDGYQFQAAIFQPKSDYKGYRAPSLSKGNRWETRWETATSALSFD